MRGALLLWLAVGCASSQGDSGVSLGFPPRDHIFGGQTGSLVPSCGVAPLSQGRLAVPVGDVLGVLYTSGCPEGASGMFRVTGPDTRAVGVRLEPLAGSGVYLVRADASVAAGDYRLELPDASSSTLAVADAAAPLPAALGALEAVVTSNLCGDVTFEWTLEPEVLAHAALLRLSVRIDGGPEQLWIDYGALEVDAETAVARLRLPRCGVSGCLADGVHELEVQAEIAGEATQPEPLGVTFELSCGEARASSLAEDDASTSACSTSSSGRAGRAPLGAMICAWLYGFRQLGRRRARARSPGPSA